MSIWLHAFLTFVVLTSTNVAFAIFYSHDWNTVVTAFIYQAVACLCTANSIRVANK